MREAGFTIAQIAEKAGIPRTTMASRLRSLGIKPKLPVITKDRGLMITREELERLYWQENNSIGDIAERYNVSHSSVIEWFDKLGVLKRSRSEGMSVAHQKRGSWTRGNGSSAERMAELGKLRMERMREEGTLSDYMKKVRKGRK